MKVTIIKHQDILDASITPLQCIEWVKESFKMKNRSTLPPKISIHPQGDDFFNTMPCLLPEEYGRFSVKEVHRIAGQEPALGSDILLYDSRTGRLIAIMDGDWITNMRTGAVAALSALLFKREDVNTFSFIGLGNTARATALCLIESYHDQPLTIRLFKYKNHTSLFEHRFKEYKNVTFEIVDNIEQFIADAEVIISCITAANGLICSRDELYQPGVVLIPVHTRGFQNCDLFFDKVYGDDTGHLQGFKYFHQFKSFDELSRVLLGKTPGRESDQERILCYNIGLGLHDAVYASRIYDMICNNELLQHYDPNKEIRKFWV